jgi:hypothetical protein
MTSTLDNGTYDFTDLSGATVQGGQYRDTGIVRIGSANPTIFSDASSQMLTLECLELQIGAASSTIELTNVALRITSGADNAFGTNKYLSSTGTGVELTMEGCLCSSRLSRLIMRGSGHDAVLRDCVFDIIGMALYGTGTIINNVTILGLGSSSSSGLGIRETFTNPIESLTLKDSTNGFNCYGSANATVRNSVIDSSSVTYAFYCQGENPQGFTGTFTTIGLSANFDSIYWARGGNFESLAGDIVQKEVYSFSALDSGNSPISGLRVYLEDADNAVAFNDVTDGSGEIPDQELTKNIYSYGGSGSGVHSSVGTTDAKEPYLLRKRKYGVRSKSDPNLLLPQGIGVNAVGEKFEVNPFVTAADASTALAVTNPTTANEIYDHSQATYAESGNIQYAEKITTNDGVTLTFDLDVTINASATSETYDFANNAVEYVNITNGTFSTLTLGANRTLTLGNYSAYASSDWSIPATATINVDACPSTLDLSNWAFADGASFEITDGGSTTITVSSSALATQLDADKVETSGSITFSAPVLTVTIPVQSGSRIYIYEADTTTVNASTDSSGTSFAWTQGTPGDDYDIYIIKPGTESQRILAYTYPSASATLTVQQPTDENYSATSGLDIDDTASGTAIGSTADVWLDPDNGAFYLDTGVNLSQPTGITGQQLYSLFVEARFSSTRAGVIQAHRGIFAVDIDAGKLLLNGLAFGDNTTRDLIRNVGVAQFDEVGGTLEAEWMGIIGRGSLASTSTAYYWQVDTTNPTITNCINTGLPNQLIPIYGNASNGDFDYRDFFKISVRKQGENPSTYDLVDSGEITTLTPRAYEIFLTTTANPNLTVADTSIDANSDGTADVAPYDGMSITWLTSAAVDDWADATAYDPFDYVEDDSSFWITVEGGTSSGTGVADDTGVTWYEIDKIYDANGGDLSQMTNYLFWAQRQTVDIDAGTGTQKGSTVDSLATTRGSDLVLAPGLWAINFAASAQNHHFPTEVDGAEYEYPVPPATLTWSGIADGARFFAARQQTFGIQSTDISTANNTISLGNDTETTSAFSGQITTPATLARLTLATGATIPTTSPQIVDGNLYYVVANTSGVIQISESEGGTAVTFSDDGTENGSNELFTLTCETELVNEVVSSGVSSVLTLPEGALINTAAIHRASASSCSTLFTRQLEWSTSTGATIADTFSATNNPDTIHNALVGTTIRSKSGLSVTVSSDGSTVAGLSFDLSGNIELDANAITDSIISFPDGYLWAKAMQATEAGIRFIRNQFTAVGIMDYRFEKLRLDNVADGTRNSPATPLTCYGNVEPTVQGAGIIAEGSGTVHIIPFFVADIESEINTGSGLTTAQSNQLLALYNTTTAGTGATVFSTDALQNAPSGSGLDAAGVRSAIGLASANLDTQLADLPTVAEFEARTLPSADYFDSDNDVVLVGGYDSGQNPPSTVSIRQEIDSNSTQLAAIKAKTDPLTFTVANQVDANALTGGGGDDAATIYSYFTASDRQDEFHADLTSVSSSLTAIQGTGFDTSTDSLTAIRDRGDAAWTGSGGGSGGTLNTSLAEFIGRMLSDSAYRRALSEAAATPALVDELSTVRTQQWLNESWQADWNTLITTVGTSPSTGEIAAWNGYASGLDISFGATGEVSS